jgi:hypothetical protein
VSGIITYVGVLQHLGATDMLGQVAADMNAPILAVLFVCCVAKSVSAFAYTTAMLAALVPRPIPLVASGEIPGWALICAIGICASIVDISPFSSVGAVLVASAPAGPTAHDPVADAVGPALGDHRARRGDRRAGAARDGPATLIAPTPWSWSSPL